MKKIAKNFFIKIFKYLTLIYLKINRIEVIAITGSVGKTSTKVALGQLLTSKEAFVPIENYNTEIGVPLVIFKEKTPENITSLKDWLRITFQMIGKVFKKAPYKRIVLEFSAERIGDIRYLTSFIKPQIAIVTNVFPVHTLEFKTVTNIAKEKGYLVEAAKKDSIVILNADDKYVRQMAKRTEAKVIFVGEDEKAEIKWKNLKFKPSGISFDLFVRGQKYQIKTSIIAPQLIFSMISALTVGLILNLEIRDLISKLEAFCPEKGRMNVIEGKDKSIIIDDSYNANPSSVKASLEVLAKMDGRKVAVLGSMKDLGSFEKEGHEQIIRQAVEVSDEVYLVGEEMLKFSKLRLGKLNKKIVQKFANSKEAGEYLSNNVQANDVILVKGSQSMFMEEAIKSIMAEPKNAGKLLVRQGRMWEDKKADLDKEK